MFGSSQLKVGPGRRDTRMSVWRGRATTAMTVALRRALGRLSNGSLIVTPYPLRNQSTYGWTQPPHGELTDLLAEGEDGYRGVLALAENVLVDLRAIARTSETADASSLAPWWENSFFSSLDAVVLYSEIVRREPTTYFEVGSGHSTRFVAHAVRTHSLDTRIVSVDPSPRTEVDSLCDRIHRSPFEALDLDNVELAAEDVVLIDGSHVATMGSDVVRAFLEFLPRIPPGVLVGIDDIFLPWDYPDTWGERFYGEQYLLAVMLLAGDPRWRVYFPGWFASHWQPLDDAISLFEDPARVRFGLHGTTMWLERV